jgi:uncharacterized membrane protein
MPAGAALFVLLAALFVIGVPVLAIAAYVNVKKLKQSAGAEAAQLIRRIYALEQRLTQIEKGLAALAAPAAGIPQREATDSAPTTAVPPPIPTAPSLAAPLPSQPARPSVVSAPAMPPAPHLPASVREQVPAHPSPISRTVVAGHGDEGNFEAIVAGRWLNYVGILALLFAVTFFLKYAFDNNWVGPRGRVGIGLLAGSILYPWSHHLLARGYKYFSEGIAGLGAAVLYLSLWAGWHYYHIFPQSTAFALMIVVTAATLVVAVGRNSERIAFLALVGGLITTLVYFWGWYSDFYRADELVTTVLFATVFFVLFAALPLVRSWRDGELSGLEAGIVLVNSLAYLAALREMLWPDDRWALTVAVLALAAAHLAAERMLPEKRGTETRLARILYPGLALTFVTLAIPIRLDGRWITIAWAVQGAVLIWTGLRVRIAALRWAGLALFAIVAGRLALIPIPAHTFLLNARFATFAICVACMGMGCYFAATSDEELGEQESMNFVIAAVVANILAVAALSLEVWDVFGRMHSLGIDRGHAQELALSMLWLVWALGLLGAGLWKQSQTIRWQALVLLGVVIVKVFLFDLSFLERFYRIVSFLLLGLALMLISFYYQRQLLGRKDERKA